MKYKSYAYLYVLDKDRPVKYTEPMESSLSVLTKAYLEEFKKQTSLDRKYKKLTKKYLKLTKEYLNE